MTLQTNAKVVGIHGEKTKIPPKFIDSNKHDKDIGKLSHLLQQTIDIDLLIQSFFQHLKKIVSIESLNFSSKKQPLSFSIGQPKRHHCQYQIKLEGEVLADIQLTRKKRFSDYELEIIEKSLAHLVFPVKNALLYHTALMSALVDPLSNLKNRRAFEQDIEITVASSQRYQQRLSMLVIDIDHFKRVNDEHGHLVGDCVLKHVAKIIKDSSRMCDYCYRFGGEEFVVLLKNTGICGARLTAERIKHALSTSPLLVEDKSIDVTVSIGISELTGDSENLFNEADNALYQAKESGRNCIKVAQQCLHPS